MDIKDQIVKDIRILSTEILLDTETPISLYLKVRQKHKKSFLLESVEEGNNVGRYSIVGWGCLKTFVAYHDRVLINDMEIKTNTVFDKLEDFISGYDVLEDGDFNGFYGYLSYDSVYEIEPTISDKPLYGELPLANFILPEILAVFDKLSHKVKFIFNLDQDSALPDVSSVINTILSEKVISNYLNGSSAVEQKRDIQSNVPKNIYKEMVNQAKEYIYSGDIFQVVLSQRFSVDYTGDPFEIYRYLCSLNPSPYMFYFQFEDDFSLMGTSPEIMLKKEGKKLTIRPIAGTRKRGKTNEEDEQIMKELLADEKENAEHLMLVDLARNDLNRICKSDTVTVDTYKTIEKYSHVMHIVSSVTGDIAENKDLISAIKASFPAGTLSGAPKVRAMQIIRELESNPRQIYGGMVGYFDFKQNFDSCITIRSILINKQKAYFQAGAGIVADSDPDYEYEETLSKARAMLKALSHSKG